MTSRGGGGLRIKKKARGFMCGCGDSKAVSVSDGCSADDKQSSSVATPPTAAVSSSTTSFSTTTTTSTTKHQKQATTRRGAGNKQMAADAPSSSVFSPSSCYADTSDDARSSSVEMEENTPSLSALLRQLRELERSVRFLQAAAAPHERDDDAGNKNKGRDGRRHRRTVSEGAGRVEEESVAVVKESADPLGDFRRSMLQMIVEKEIVGGAELRELLHRFLSLNAPHHHHLILQAFAEIWEEVFAGYDRTPDFLSRRHRNQQIQTARA